MRTRAAITTKPPQYCPVCKREMVLEKGYKRRRPHFVCYSCGLGRPQR